MGKRVSLLTFLSFSFFGSLCLAQEGGIDLKPVYATEIGNPFIQNYGPGEYEGFYQNWDTVQDSLGTLYFGNGDGVLSYNGVQWQLLKLPLIESVFSLAIDDDGKIFVGAQRELGYLKIDSKGQLQYSSLLPFLPEKYSDFYVVWNTYSTSDGIYFDTKKYLFRWNGHEFDIWKNEFGEGQRSFHVHNKLFVNKMGKGLMQMVDDKLESVPGGDEFKETKVRFMIPYDEQRIMLATNEKLFIYDGVQFIPFFIDNEDFLSDGNLYCGLMLSDNSIALGSLQKGILIVDKNGRQRNFIDQESGLRSNQVTRLFHDKSGLLWATMFTGVSKIEYPSPFSNFGGTNVDGSVIFSIERFDKRIFVATSTGLYFLDSERSSSKSQLIEFNEEIGNVWDMVHFDGRLLTAGDRGIHEIKGDGLTKQISEVQANCIKRSKLNPNRIFIGLSPGFGTLYYENGEWKEELIDRKINEEVPEIIEHKDGTIWLGTDHGRLVKLSFKTRLNAHDFIDPITSYYTESQGIPKDVGKPYLIKDDIYFHVIIGDNVGSLYAYEPQSDKFTLDNTLYESLGFENAKVRINSVDASENIWLTTYEDDNPHNQFLAVSQSSEPFTIIELNESRIVDDRKGARFVELEDSVVWHGSENGILKHDLKEQLNPFKYRPRAHVAKVRYQGDSILYAGRGDLSPSVPFKKNELRFEFSLPEYHDEASNQFQYALDGFDTEWSSWTTETKKDYTSLAEGDYVFRVRGKNILGEISQEDNYGFTITPPWYRSLWAYFGYVVIGGLLLWLFAWWRSQQLHRKNVILEGIIQRRTKEIKDKNKLLGYQTERLKEMDIMKTRLFANISHEFRTPLTLIKGPIEKLERTEENVISTTNVKMIRRNANRLLNLVNQLLDLSKLDSGKLKLNLAEGDVFKCIRTAASSFSSHAASRNMDYQIKISSRLLWASFDRDKLEKIMYNLLSNAFKFTEDEGKVVIEAEFRSGRLRLKVSDTGSGIATDKLPHIFDRFFQVDDSYIKEKSGSGIGLALTKELVELMGGTVFVESELNKGTLFRVVIPLEEIKSNKTSEIEDIPVAIYDEDIQGSWSAKSTKKNCRVLIIEDNKDMRHFIREQLDFDYGVLEARNGKEALVMLNKQVPDLIITDLMMPQMDGMTLCKKIKTNINTSHVPVIMLTAKAGLENKLEGLETGADEYLTKPFNAKELQIRIKNLIEQRQKLRERFSKNISLHPKEITVTSLDEKFLQQFLSMLEEKYSDSEFGVPQIQKGLGMSKTKLHTKVKALTNRPPGELLRNFRLKRAAQILSQSGENVSQIAYDVGFNSLSYFTRCFKEVYKVSPSEYIKKNT